MEVRVDTIDKQIGEYVLSYQSIIKSRVVFVLAPDMTVCLNYWISMLKGESVFGRNKGLCRYESMATYAIVLRATCQ